jgi:hypothetical protein
MNADTQKKAIAVGAFIVIAALILSYQLRDNSPVPRAPQASAATATSNQTAAPKSGSKAGSDAKNVGTTSAQLDPTLRMGPMLVTEKLVYSGSGRNIFSAASAPVEIPQPKFPPRPKPGPPPAPLPPPGPPPPPPIDLKFFGTATSANGKRQAFLLHGEDVFLASDGDIVQRRYRVVTVSANSVLVEDMSYNNRQTLPLIGR